MANKDDIVKKTALGATGVAITAGAIAAGVALANKKNRTKVKKIASKTIKKLGKVREAIQEGADRYQAYQHRIGMGRGKAKGLMKKSAHGRRKKLIRS